MSVTFLTDEDKNKLDQDISKLSQELTELEADVSNLSQNKADKTDLTELEADVSNLSQNKADKTDLTNPFNFKGSTTYAELPTTGNTINDTYYCTDLKRRYTWNGTEWYPSSLDETEYTDELNQLSEEIASFDNFLGETITDYSYSGGADVDSPVALDLVIKANSVIKDIYVLSREQFTNGDIYVIDAERKVVLETINIPYREKIILNRKYDVDVMLGGFYRAGYLMPADSNGGTVHKYIRCTVTDNVVKLEKNEDITLNYAVKINVLSKEEESVNPYKDTLIVSKDRNGDFTTINEAVTFAKNVL